MNTDDYMQQKNISDFIKELKKEDKSDDQFLTINGNIPLDINENSYINLIRKSTKSIHNIGFQPGKFVPELPRWAISKFVKKYEVVLDPFCGSGTTLVEANLHSRNALGIDYNPIARLISEVKTTPIKEELLRKGMRELIKAVYQDNRKDYEIPKFRGLSFWFSEDAIKALAIIKKHILNIENDSLRKFFLVVFSLIVRKASYCADGQLLLAKRKAHNNKKRLSVEKIFEMFKNETRSHVDLLRKFSKMIEKEVYSRIVGIDARSFNFSEEFDAIVTSPPYINAIDYIWANRLRIHWLDLVKDDQDRLNLYAQEIGTERIPNKIWKKLHKTGFHEELDKKIEQIYTGVFYKASGSQNKLRAAVVYKYFMDMKKHLEEAYKVLPDNSIYCLVMGDNKICKVSIPTADYLTYIAENAGFEKGFQFQILLKNRFLNIPRNVEWATMIDYDRMIVLKKT